MSPRSHLRCAIYTRKSSEEGLDQDFNSLDAQREACEAFVASQASLGWRVLRQHYDDGGYSGGTLERPALQRLMEDVKAGHVDDVVVYKIDRLTRSLTDFARIVEVFDGKAVSFVSVTQSFNTTSSMGRLTLNVLLSFAQFEREVTGERIRDKIAASKKKGMWMGGVIPLGYDAEDRKLVVNEAEAETVRQLFRLYLQLASVRSLQRQAIDLGLKTKRHTSPKSGRTRGGRCFSCGHLRAILSNPIYLGKIRHGTEVHEGQHEAIIDQEIFDQAQSLLAKRANRSVTAKSADGLHLLAGRLFDETGDRLGPTHATKGGKRYRYYVSRSILTNKGGSSSAGWRVPAHAIEHAVKGRLNRFLRSRAELLDLIRHSGAGLLTLDQVVLNARNLAEALDDASPSRQKEAIELLAVRVTVGRSAVRIDVDPMPILSSRDSGQHQSGTSSWTGAGGPVHSLEMSVAIRRRGIEMRMVIDENQRVTAPDQGLIALIARAHHLLNALTDGSGTTIAYLAEREKLDVSDLSRIVRLAFLAPAITEAIIAGRQPLELTPTHLMRLGKIPYDWQQQQRLFGF